MLTISDSARVYLACGPTDMRKSIDGLAAVVQYAFELDPFDTSLFVFCNRERNKIKVLCWDTNGFWLIYRRLEKGRFRWPSSAAGQTRTVTRRQLQWLLDGLKIEQKQSHAPVAVKIAA